MKMSLFVKALAICAVCLSHPTAAHRFSRGAKQAVSALQEEIRYLAKQENAGPGLLESKIKDVKDIFANRLVEGTNTHSVI